MLNNDFEYIDNYVNKKLAILSYLKYKKNNKRCVRV